MKEKDLSYTLFDTDKEKTIHVIPLSNCFDSIEAHINQLQEQKDKLQQELSVLKETKEELWKDKEIQKMKAERDSAIEDLNRGFGISEEEYKNLREWKQKHYTQHYLGGTIGGQYTYEFIPTSIGTIGTIKCSCGASFDFQKILNN